MKSKIAVIGANSYIGRNLAYYMQKSEMDFMLYDYQPIHMDNAANYRRIDVFNEKDFLPIVQDFTHIYLFIGKTGTDQGFEDYNAFIDINQRVLLNLLNACKNSHCFPKIVFPSTRLVYKGSADLLSEDDEKEFKSIYAIQKYACESYLELYHNQFGINYCIFRICVPFGSLVYPVSSYGTVDFFLTRAKQGSCITLYGDGDQKRTFTYIGDLVKILFRAALQENCINAVYNIGGDSASILQVASMIAHKYAVPIERVPWPQQKLIMETGDTVFSCEKLSRIFPHHYLKLSQWINEENTLEK